MASVLAISGKSGAGKDVIASYLVRVHGFHRVAWSDELKHEVATRLRLTVKAITTMDERLGRLPGLPRELRMHPDMPEQDEAWWTARIHYALWIERSPACRALLQEYGTDVRRADYDAYWLDAWERRVSRLLGSGALSRASYGTRVVVPDTRFPNETRRALERGALLVRVERPDAPPCPSAGHESETALDDWADWDLRLQNGGTVAELEAAVEEWLRHKGIAP